MMEKTATTKGAPEQTLPKVPALFLETSAQFHRLTGPPGFQSTIEELISKADKVGTSAHVKREFDYVYGGFFKSVIFNVRRLEGWSRERNFSGMWSEVQHHMPRRYLGGPDLFTSIGVALAEDFGKKPVSPMMLLNVLEGLKTRLMGGFRKADPDCFFDKSSCGVWDKPCSCPCGPEPGDECRLKDLCVTMRTEFLASARTLAGARSCAESKWLNENLDLLEAAHGTALMKLLGEHPGHVGDPVIFWEAPEPWTILTRDPCFKILQRAHRDDLRVFILRLPRLVSGGSCTVLPEAAITQVNGVLIDHNSQGARIRAPGASVKRRQRVTIKAREFENGAGENAREGRVAYLDKKDTSVFAVRFPSP